MLTRIASSTRPSRRPAWLTRRSSRSKERRTASSAAAPASDSRTRAGSRPVSSAMSSEDEAARRSTARTRASRSRISVPASVARATAEPPAASASRPCAEIVTESTSSRTAAIIGSSRSMDGGSPGAKRSVRKRTPIGHRGRPAQATALAAHQLQAPAAEVDRQQRVRRARGDHPAEGELGLLGAGQHPRDHAGRQLQPVEQLGGVAGHPGGRRAGHHDAVDAPGRGPRRPSGARSAPPGRGRRRGSVPRASGRRRAPSSRCRSPGAPPGRPMPARPGAAWCWYPTSIAATGAGGSAGSSICEVICGRSTSGRECSAAPTWSGPFTRLLHAGGAGPGEGAPARDARGRAHEGERPDDGPDDGQPQLPRDDRPRRPARRPWRRGGSRRSGPGCRGRRSRRPGRGGVARSAPREGGAGRGEGCLGELSGAGGCVHGANSSSCLGREQVFVSIVQRRSLQHRLHARHLRTGVARGSPGGNPLPMGGRMGWLWGHVG